MPLLCLLVLALVLASSEGGGDAGMGRCEFPARWHGTWFHLGFPRPLNITADAIDSKGRCTHSDGGSRFLVWEK